MRHLTDVSGKLPVLLYVVPDPASDWWSCVTMAIRSRRFRTCRGCQALKRNKCAGSQLRPIEIHRPSACRFAACCRLSGERDAGVPERARRNPPLWNEFAALLTDTSFTEGFLQEPRGVRHRPHWAHRFASCSCPARGVASSRRATGTRPASDHWPGSRANAPGPRRPWKRWPLPHHARGWCSWRAQPGTLREVARTLEELSAIGLTGHHLVLNGVYPESEVDGDALAASIVRREQAAIAPDARCPARPASNDVALKPLIWWGPTRCVTC